jgi:hypothetical protein
MAASGAGKKGRSYASQLEPVAVLADMDPKLQRYMERRRRGLCPPATSSTEQDEIAVIARVQDVKAWLAMSEVREGAMIGNASRGGGSIVTARIPLGQLESLRKRPGVLSVKPAHRLRPMLAASLKETHADSLPALTSAGAGRGAIVGIIDYGCDFAHKNFRKSDGSSRVLALWDQAGPSSASSPFGYGALYERADLDAALRRPDPYAALGYAPEEAAHGTHVMDIASGNGRGTGTRGLAPEADILFVQISASDVPWDGEQVVGPTFGDSVHLLEALKFIFDRAGSRPCAVNISLGTNGGPHDGSTLVEQGIDELLTQASNRAVAIAASNSYGDGIHAAGTVPAAGSTDLQWAIADGDGTGNELEVWYDKADAFVLEIIDPTGQSLGSVSLGSSSRLKDDQGQTALFAAHRRGDPNNGDNVIGVYLEAGFGKGTWTLRLHGASVSNGAFHAWIERDDAGPSAFAPPHDNSHTLGSISTGHRTIVVGSYDAHKSNTPISWFSSAGQTRDGRQKPEISAPGHDVWAAKSLSGDGATRMSGTSMATPAVTGIMACLLAEAKARGVSLGIDQIRSILASCVRPTAAGGWDSRYGFGRIDAAAVIQAVQQLAPSPAAGAGALSKRRKTAPAAAPRASLGGVRVKARALQKTR